jgi:imidazoleglycerol-phosphate dehydratase
MLSLLVYHGGLDLSLQAQGDLGVDSHHTVEDAGICLGDGIRKALGEGKGVREDTERRRFRWTETHRSRWTVRTGPPSSFT